MRGGGGAWGGEIGGGGRGEEWEGRRHLKAITFPQPCNFEGDWWDLNLDNGPRFEFKELLIH